MSRGPDAATLLERASVANARAAGLTVSVREGTWTRWASVTFSGARHRLTLTGSQGAATSGWLAGLPEAEFPLRGHLVADLIVESCTADGQGFVATIEVLTVKDR